MSAYRLILSVFVSLVLGLVAHAQIQSVGIAGDGEFTRITIASDSALRAEVFHDVTDGFRTLQLVSRDYTIGSDPYFGEPTGGVSAYTLDTDEIVFELDFPMMIVRELDLPPTGAESRHRLILDIAYVSEARFDQAATKDARRYARLLREGPDPIPQAVAVSAPTPEIPLAEPPTSKPWGIGPILDAVQQRKHVVVIDPGHGGHDPGALPVTGGKESDIVLQTALALKEELGRDPRYEVRLTRETDIYLEHEVRVTRARNWGADLFISLHADAARTADVSGASVYTISTTGERRIDGASNKYGWNLPIEDGTPDEVSGILEDLIKRETKSNSTIFAELLVPELAQAGPLLRNTHRQKNLFVLLAPDVPAVLVEIGFVTNRQDASRLKSERGRRKSARAIKRAIDAYFDRQDLLLASN